MSRRANPPTTEQLAEFKRLYGEANEVVANHEEFLQLIYTAALNVHRESRPVEASKHLLSTIQPRPLEYPLDDYWNAPSGKGPLGAEWRNKPHRIVYDLIAAILHNR